MDREQALELLTEAHALALRLVDGGADTAVIATQLDIEGEAVPLLLRVAEDKPATHLGRLPPAARNRPPPRRARNATRHDPANHKERF